MKCGSNKNDLDRVKRIRSDWEKIRKVMRRILVTRKY